MKLRVLFSLTCGLLLLGFPLSRAVGQTVDLQLLNFLPPFGAGYDGTVTIGSASQGSLLATLQHFASTNWQPAQIGQPTTLDLFCAEFAQHSDSGVRTYQLLSADNTDSLRTASSLETAAGIGLSGIGSARAANLERLYGFQFAGGYNPQALDNDHRAGFQLAVWKLSHSDNFNHIEINDPSFAASGYAASAVVIADALLDTVASNAVIQSMDLVALHSDTYQDFLVPTMELAPIPEPSAYAAMFGAVALGAVLVRRRQTAV